MPRGELDDDVVGRSRAASADLRSAQTYAEITEHVLSLAVNRRDPRLRDLPAGKLVRLGAAAAEFETAMRLVLRDLAPDVARSAGSLAALSRRRCRK